MEDFDEKTEESHLNKETTHLNTQELFTRRFQTSNISETLLNFVELLNRNIMDDQPMWAANHVVAPTPGEIRAFSHHEGETLTDAWLRMKEMLRNCHGHNLPKGGIIKIFYHGLSETIQEVLNAVAGCIFLYKTPNQAYQLLEDKVLLKLNWAKNQKSKPIKRTVAFADEGPSKTDTKKIMAQMDAMTMKMDAHYKELHSQSKQSTPDENVDDLPMSREEEAKFMQTFPYQPPQSRNEHVNDVFTRSGKTNDSLINPNEQQENTKFFDSDDEDEEPIPQPKPQLPKPTKETPTPKPYKQKIPYPQRLRKEKMEAQYGKFLDIICVVRINVPLVDVLAGMPNYGKFLKDLISNKHKIEQISTAFLSDESSTMIQNKVPPKFRDPRSFLIPCNFNKAFSSNALANLAENMLIEVGIFTFPVDFVILEMEEDRKIPLILGRSFLHTADAVIRVKQKQLTLRVGTERMIFNIDSAIKYFYSNDDTCFSIDVIDEILEEDFDALLDEGSQILHSIEGTILEENLFAEFDEFIAMATDENSESETEEEHEFEKITVNTDFKIKTSLEEPPTDLELKPLPDNLECVFLEEPSLLPVIISSQLSTNNKNKLISVLKKHKQAFAWKMIDIPGICPLFCKHKIQLLDDKRPVVQKQRRLNPNMQEVVKKEIVKLLDTGIIYLIVDSPWVSPIHCMPKKGGITVVTNKNNELVPTRIVTGWRVCIDYRKFNEATAKDHFPLPFMDQMLERLAGNKYFCFLDGFSRYFQILIDPMDKEKITFTCPFGTYAYRRMPFGLCNAPATFQRCMLEIFHDMIEESVEVFMDDFSVFGNSFDKCLNNLD
ncbi:reverse transcriptase domain-containing protein [Tanacetum coccineum]